MKNLYVLILALTISVSANAQNFSYPVGQHIFSIVQNLNFEGYEIKINTPAPEAIHYNWELVSNTFPAAWSYSLCDYGGCSVGIPPSGSMTPITLIEAQDSVIGWFKLNLTVGQNSGQGKVEIYVYDSDDYSRGDTVSWEASWDASTASLSVNSNDEIAIYPNPASDQITINNAEGYQGAIFNNLGQVVLSINSFDNTKIDVSKLESGIYIISLQNKDGLTISEQLIIQ